jgi:DNA-binding NarL/FixJ family response regulator
MQKISILIVESQRLLREAWTGLLNADERFVVIDSSGDGKDALKKILFHKPDVVLVDSHISGISSIELTKTICKKLPDTRILGVLLTSQVFYAQKMMKEGATGFISGRSSLQELLFAILEVFDNRRYISSEIIKLENAATKTLDHLSQREMEVAGMVKEGYSSKDISATMNITHKTVEAHRYNILKKLNLRNTAALVNLINLYDVFVK